MQPWVWVRVISKEKAGRGGDDTDDETPYIEYWKSIIHAFRSCAKEIDRNEDLCSEPDALEWRSIILEASTASATCKAIRDLAKYPPK